MIIPYDGSDGFSAGLSSVISHPINRASEQRSIRCVETTMQCATNDGQMTCCPVGQMIDDQMISAMLRDGALVLKVRGCHLSSPIRSTEHPNIGASDWARRVSLHGENRWSDGSMPRCSDE